MLHMTSSGSHADLAHRWCFLVKRSLSVLCMTKLARKNRSYPLQKEAGWGQCPGRVDYAAWLHAARSGAWHVYWWPDDTSGACFQPVVVLPLVTSSCGLLYWKRVALRCLTLIHSWKLECLDSFCSSTSAFVGWCACGRHQIGTQGFSIYIASAFTLTDTHSLALEGGK